MELLVVILGYFLYMYILWKVLCFMVRGISRAWYRGKNESE